MPIYEYRCEQCEQLSEFFLRISDPHPESCPRCGESGALRKQISQTSFALKGEGWYVTDYKKAAPAKDETNAAEKPAAAATDGKAADAAAGATPAPAAGASTGGTTASGSSPKASAGKDSTPASRTSSGSSGD